MHDLGRRVRVFGDQFVPAAVSRAHPEAKVLGACERFGEGLIATKARGSNQRETPAVGVDGAIEADDPSAGFGELTDRSAAHDAVVDDNPAVERVVAEVLDSLAFEVLGCNR